MTTTKGTPQDQPEKLPDRVLELQALVAVQEARARSLRRLVIAALELQKVTAPDGRTLDQFLRDLTDEELDRQLGTVADDDPRHASHIVKVLRAAKSKPPPETNDAP